ncbi:Uncharacterized protein Rs2_50526 [Raphanus sativus]|nr:Uncharacterized protein Rs2_50526 [Raphanus sativus]
MGKKKFIDKKKAATFELCPRDTSDPLYSDAPGGDKIFLRVDQNPVNINGFTEDNSHFAGSSSSSNNPLPAHVRKEILELGYPDDGYNYLDHLREIKNTGGGSNFYSNPKFEGEYLPRDDVKAYDASRVKVKKAIDPEVAALLEDSDGSEFGSDVEDLEEDFVVQAQEGEGNEEVMVEFADERPVVVESKPRTVGNNFIYEKPKGYELDDEKYMNPADLLKNSDNVKDKEELENIIRRSVQYGEDLVNGNEDEFVEVVEESSDESEKWDCETIVTTYSNLDNHPGRICDPERARKKLSEALAKAKSVNGSGSRIITLQGKEKLPVEFLPGRRAEQTSSVKPKAEPRAQKAVAVSGPSSIPL